MKFLSSKEAVALVGVKMEDVPHHKRRKSAINGNASPESEARDLPPPSWEQSDGERRQSEAYDRRNLATPVQMQIGLANEPLDIGTPNGEGGNDVAQESESVTESTPVTETHPVTATDSEGDTEPKTETER